MEWDVSQSRSIRNSGFEFLPAPRISKRSSEKTTANSRRKNSGVYLNRSVDPPPCPGNELPAPQCLRSDALSKSLQVRRPHHSRLWSGFMDWPPTFMAFAPREAPPREAPAWFFARKRG